MKIYAAVGSESIGSEFPHWVATSTDQRNTRIKSFRPRFKPQRFCVAVTNLSETGADARTIQSFSGHKSEGMVFRYTHARDTRVDDALEKMEEAKTKAEQKHRQKHQRS